MGSTLFNAVERLEAADIERLISWDADARAVAEPRIHGRATLTEHALAGEKLFCSTRLKLLRPLAFSLPRRVDRRARAGFGDGP